MVLGTRILEEARPPNTTHPGVRAFIQHIGGKNLQCLCPYRLRNTFFIEKFMRTFRYWLKKLWLKELCGLDGPQRLDSGRGAQRMVTIDPRPETQVRGMADESVAVRQAAQVSGKPPVRRRRSGGHQRHEDVSADKVLESAMAALGPEEQASKQR